MVAKVDTSSPAPDIAVHPVLSLVAVSENLLDTWHPLGRSRFRQTLEPTPMGNRARIARDNPHGQLVLFPAMRPLNLSHALHEPR